MGSTFGGLSTALSGLYSARKGLDLTGQNIANANTEGYTRQRLNLEAVGQPTTAAFFAKYDGVGGGVTVTDVQRLRDAFMEGRGHTEHGRNSYLATRAVALSRVEDVLGEPGDTGLQAQMSEFWNSWHDLANRPGDGAARTQLLQRAGTLVDGLHQASSSLESQWRGSHDQLRVLVAEVNTTASTIAELNASIRRDTQAGISPNELMDQRDKLIMQLADKIGATVKPGADGAVDVYVGGTSLVRGADVQKLQVSGATTFDQTMTTPPTAVVVSWTHDNYPAAVSLGEAAGLLEAVNTTVPGYQRSLDSFTAQLATDVNTVHRSGYGSDGVNNRDFFAGTTAKTVTIAVTGKDQIAASSLPGGVLDGSTADAIAKIAGLPNGPDARYRQLTVELGVDAQNANRRTSIQANITTQVDAARDAQAGVDLDEEMTNMLAFQHAYAGAARVLTAVDEALDILINRTGQVGR